MRQYETYVWTIPAPEGGELWANICNGTDRYRIKGFYAGNGQYKLRFLPKTAGEYHYQFFGVDSGCGTVLCQPAAGRHGIVHTEGTHFRFEDGAWFYPFGTTVYALIHQPDALVEQTMDTLRRAPFNKIRICVFPKDFAYNKNEPFLFPFEKNKGGWDVTKPCLPFWDALERRIAQLGAMGIEADVILLHPYDRWGFAHLSVSDAVQYLQYAVTRLAAFPNVWWSLANEYDIMGYTLDDWRLFARTVREADPYGHLLGNHNMVVPWDPRDRSTTHACLQLKSVDDVSRTIRTFGKPLMVDECGYEGNIPFEWGNHSGFEMVDRFWKIVCQGGYASHGETFLDDNDILWWSKGGALRGESPARIGFLRKIVEGLPGPLTYAAHDMTPAEAAQTPPDWLGNLAGKVCWEQLYPLLLADKRFIAKCGEDAYLEYYAGHCVGIGELDLPEGACYRVELIDVWEMTRVTLAERASGHVRFPLPGKTGMALLAVRMNGSRADLPDDHPTDK